MPIKLPKETTQDLIHSLQKYFLEELDQEIGDLRASLLLDFLLVEVGPTVYNKAIIDAQRYFQDKTLDLDSSLYEPEMTFWQPQRKGPERR